MPVVRRLGPDDWEIWRTARLAALADAPDAFGSSAERDAAFSEAWWREQMAVGLWAATLAGRDAVGIVGGYVRPDRERVARLVSMWVHPSFRGQRIAESLAAEVIAWSREQRVGMVELWVMDGNARAQAVYERLGFVFTGEIQPNELHPGLCQRLMIRTLQPSERRQAQAPLPQIE